MLSTLTIYATKSSFIMSIIWIRETCSNNNVAGYRQQMKQIPFSAIERVLNGEQVTLLCNMDYPNTTVSIDPSAQKKLSVLCRDKLIKSALRKALGWYFQYPDTKTVLYPDIGHDLFFSTDDGLSGGLCFSSGYVRGRDGRVYTRIRYSVHT